MTEAVLVHGTPLDRRAWGPLVAELPDVRCVAYDLPGHGARAVEELTTYDALADDLARVLDAHRLDRAHVVGHSFGGQVAATFAVRRPARVASVAIVCCRLEPIPAFVPAADALEADGVAAIADAAIGRWFTPETIDRGDAGVRYARERLAAARPATLAAAYRLIAAFDGTAALAACGVPVHIVAAERDHVGERAGLRAAADAIPGATYALVEGAGHMLPLEQPARLAELLRSRWRETQ
ncbi:MAG TPA: alpha/beta fold hydrolase [Solirubrobacteraceae bacterium]|nr:alpha/beta fold hydrolase [Solirubrobacteraceae bacterium]